MKKSYDRCPNCMQSINVGDPVCSSCGFDIDNYEEKKTCLKPFTVLSNKYMIGRVIGVGGFGITYIGWDLNLQTYIAIKEYFPESIASRDTSVADASNQVVPQDAKIEIFNKGLKRYVEEAQNLSKFYTLQGIVSVKDFFYENGTGYIVMEYINGINLKQFLKNSGGKLDEATVLTLMKPVLESLYQIHNSGLVHRDISPDNIMVDSDGKIKLIDFGSARGNAAETDKTYTVILKHGYAPSEQYYAKGNQGPWTDIYSLCATMYKMLTGNIPPNSIERMENDEYVAPSSGGVTVSPRTEAVIAKGLAVKVVDRYQNIGQLLDDLYGTKPISTPVNNTPATNVFNNNSQETMSIQSMHLSMQPEMNSSSEEVAKKQKPVIIAGIIAAVAVISLIVVLLIMQPWKKDKDESDDNGGDGTTTEASTEAPDAPNVPDVPDVPDTPDAPVFEWPTEVSDDWHDYTIRLDDTVYKLPMPYSEFITKGWRADTLPTYIASGDGDYGFFYNDNMTIRVAFANFTPNEMPLNSCYVVGIEIDSRYDDVSTSAVCEVAGGVKMFESNEEYIINNVGYPDDISENTEDNERTLSYYEDDYECGLSITLKDDKVVCIDIANITQPEGIDLVGAIGKEEPELNEYYVSPAGPSVSEFDHIITVDGMNVSLPCPMSIFIEAGWKFDDNAPDYLSAGLLDSSEYVNLVKGSSRITVCIQNFTANSILPEHAIITEIEYEKEYCSLPIIFPGGADIATITDESVNNMYSYLGTLEENEYSQGCDRDDYGFGPSYYICSPYIEDSMVERANVTANFDESGVLEKYSYSVDVSKIK